MKTSLTISTKGKAMQWDGVPQLLKTVRVIGATLEGKGRAAYNERLKDIAMKPSNAIADEMRDLVPVVTGTLRAGIFAAPLRQGGGAVVGVHHVYYAPYVEYGTTHASAQPYMRPSINAVRPLAANMMAGDLGKLIAEVSASEAWHASK